MCLGGTLQINRWRHSYFVAMKFVLECASLPAGFSSEGGKVHADRQKARCRDVNSGYQNLGCPVCVAEWSETPNSNSWRLDTAMYCMIASEYPHRLKPWICPPPYSKSHIRLEYLGDTSLACNMLTDGLISKVITKHPLLASVRTKPHEKNINVERNCSLHFITR